MLIEDSLSLSQIFYYNTILYKKSGIYSGLSSLLVKSNYSFNLIVCPEKSVRRTL